MLNTSPYILLMIDETTDLSTTKQLIVYAKYLVLPVSEDGVPLGGISVRTRYLGLTSLNHADADSVTQALLSLLEMKYNVMTPELRKTLAGFGSDGANVMIGRHAGVRAKLKESAPSLISVHCAAHKLALAASETVTQVTAVNRFKGLINGMFHYLHQSPARTSRFVEVDMAEGVGRTRDFRYDVSNVNR